MVGGAREVADAMMEEENRNQFDEKPSLVLSKSKAEELLPPQTLSPGSHIGDLLVRE